MSGPFDTEDQARALPAVRAAYDAAHNSPRRGVMTEHNHRMLCEAATAAGVELGAYDHRILQWLAGYEPQTCAVLAGIISRARVAGRKRIDGSEAVTLARADGSAVLSGADLATVLDALDVAADYKRDRAACCPDCDADPADLCGTCEWRLHVADGYDDLARRIGGTQ
jgi:hypothetical protein